MHKLIHLGAAVGLLCCWVAVAQTRPVNNLNVPQLKKLAEKGDAAAQAELGRRLIIGQDMKPDIPAGLALVEKAADSGSGDAMFELFLCHRDGVGVAVNEARAEEWLARSSEFGHPRARAELLGRTLAESTDSAVIEPALRELTDLARKDEPMAQLVLGRAWARGINGRTDPGEAQTQLLKAANADDPRIALPAARAFRDGEVSLRPDPVRAASLLRRLAERGVREASIDLARSAPDSFKSMAKDSTIDRITRDANLIGLPVKFEGRLTAVPEDGVWTMHTERDRAARKASVRLIPPTAAVGAVQPGRVVRACGLVEEPGLVRTLVVDVPEPVFALSYKLIEPRLVKGPDKEDYLVEGEIRNTGKQDILAVTLKIRVFQETSGTEDVEEIDLQDLPAGTRRLFRQKFKPAKVKASGNNDPVAVEVTGKDVSW